MIHPCDPETGHTDPVSDAVIATVKDLRRYVGAYEKGVISAVQLLNMITNLLIGSSDAENRAP